jgi:hypothetical protein
MHTLPLSFAISVLSIGPLTVGGFITVLFILSRFLSAAPPSEAEQGVFGDSIALRDDLLEIDSKHQIHEGTDIDSNQTLLSLLVDIPDGLVAGRVCAIQGHVIEHANVGEGR